MEIAIKNSVLFEIYQLPLERFIHKKCLLEILKFFFEKMNSHNSQEDDKINSTRLFFLDKSS
jgi:hypothetical protein